MSGCGRLPPHYSLLAMAHVDRGPLLENERLASADSRLCRAIRDEACHPANAGQIRGEPYRRPAPILAARNWLADSFSAHMTASAITPETPDARKHHRAAQRPRGQPRSPAQICSLYVPEFARMSRCLEARRAPARGMLEERKRARLKLHISTSAECERLFRDEPRRAAALADRYPKLAGEIAREAE